MWLEQLLVTKQLPTIAQLLIARNNHTGFFGQARARMQDSAVQCVALLLQASGPMLFRGAVLTSVLSSNGIDGACWSDSTAQLVPGSAVLVKEECGVMKKEAPLIPSGTCLLLQVCGDAEVWGDFIVPAPSAHLDGAINVDIDNCFHSPLGTKLKFFGPWYGSDDMVDRSVLA